MRALTLFSSIFAALRMFMQLILTEANSSTKARTMLMARMTKTVKKDMSPRSSLSIFLFMASPSLPVVFTDACPL